MDIYNIGFSPIKKDNIKIQRLFIKEKKIIIRGKRIIKNDILIKKSNIF